MVRETCSVVLSCVKMRRCCSGHWSQLENLAIDARGSINDNDSSELWLDSVSDVLGRCQHGDQNHLGNCCRETEIPKIRRNKFDYPMADKIAAYRCLE